MGPWEGGREEGAFKHHPFPEENPAFFSGCKSSAQRRPHVPAAAEGGSGSVGGAAVLVGTGHGDPDPIPTLIPFQPIDPSDPTAHNKND